MIELLLLGGLAVYTLVDSRSGFSRTKKLAHFVGDSLGHLQGPPTPEKQVERILNASAKRVHELTAGTAQIKAHEVQIRHNAVEEEQSAARAQQLAEEALACGNEIVAEQAMTMAVEAGRRAELFMATAEQLVETHLIMEQELKVARAQHRNFETKADTIIVNAQIALANKALYELVSGFSEQGLSVQGNLKHLTEKTERDAIASGEMVRLARQDSPAGLLEQMLDKTEVQKRLEKARQKIALPPGQSSDEAGPALPPGN